MDVSSSKSNGSDQVPNETVNQESPGTIDQPAKIDEKEFFGIDENGKLHLPLARFNDHMKKQLELIGKKYIPGLHVEGYADLEIHYMLGHQILIDNLMLDLTDFSGKAKRIEELFQKIYALREVVENYTDEIRNLQKHFTSLSKKVKLFEKEINIFISLIKNNHFSQSLNFNVMTSFSDEVDSIIKILNPVHASLTKAVEDPRKTDSRTMNLYEHVNEIITKLNKVDFSRKIVLSKIASYKRSHLVILGEAGMGKTHLICNFIHQRLEQSKPALLLLGINFNAREDLFTQIKRQFEIPEEASWNDFIDAIEDAAKRFKTRILFIIDAINESDDIRIWKNGLDELLKSLTKSSLIIPVITCRESYRNLIWGDSEIENKEYVLGFSNKQDEALKRYFEYFKINPRLSAAAYEAFSHPLYVRIFCNTFGDPGQNETKIVDISGYNLYKVFDEYVNKCSKNIIENNKVPESSDPAILRRALKKLGTEIWLSGKRYLPKDRARLIIDPNTQWENNLFKAILEEDLLLTRNAIAGEEIVDFTFDLLGDFLLAQNILDERSEQEIISYFKKSKEFKDLLENKNRPRRNGILRCLAIMLPEKINKHLFEILPESQTVNVISEGALFELNPGQINSGAVNWLSKRFSSADRTDKQRILKRLVNTAHLKDHPLNADFTHSLLKGLSKDARDIVWSEWIRKEYETAYSILNEFNGLLDQIEIDEEKESRIELSAKLIAWFLTSTNKYLRDLATKSLTLYGRKFTGKFTALCGEMIPVNDPYVVERIIASAYGVAMAEPGKKEVKEFSLKIYENFFADNAPNATTHLLIRDYAKHYLLLMITKDPQIFTSIQKEKIIPPYKTGGVRNWQGDKAAEKILTGDGKAVLGFGPVDADFARNMAGSISSERNFRSALPSLKETVAKLVKRIKDLGYNSNDFTEIEKNIKNQNENTVTGENSEFKFETYSKKYSYIALFELAGYYADVFPIEDETRNFLIRSSDIDIDPSFPEVAENFDPFKIDLLGEQNLSVEDWIESEELPDLSEIFETEKIKDAEGPWVLLEGYLFREDLNSERGILISPRGFLMNKKDAGEVSKIIERTGFENFFLPESQNIYTVFAGEIPWCETFPYSGKSYLNLISEFRNEKIKSSRLKYFKNDVEITEDEANKLIFEYEKNNEGRRSRSAVLDALNIKTEIVDHEIEIENPVWKDFEIFIPTVKFNWDEQRSGVNPAQNKFVLAKEISQKAGLHSEPGAYDLFDSSGKLAAVNISWGENILNSSKLFYLRKDILEKYLSENDLALCRVLDFRKEYRNDDKEKYDEFSFRHKASKSFYDFMIHGKNEEESAGNVSTDEEKSNGKKKLFGKFFKKK